MSPADTPADAPVSRGALPQEIADAIEELLDADQSELVYNCGDYPDLDRQRHQKANDARAHLEAVILRHIEKGES